MVQTRWEHLNEGHSLLTKIQAFALDGHFVIEQSVKNKAGYYISFNGTGGVWRKECILDSGDWHTDTLTEDLDLSYRAQLKGWSFVYLKDVTTPAELPSEINSLKAQQYRWTKGAVETAKKVLPLVWRSKIPIKYKLVSTFHLTANTAFPFVLLTGILNVPLIFIKNSGPYDNIFNFMAIFLLAFISVITFYLLAQKQSSEAWHKKFVLFTVFIAGSIGFAVNNSRAVFEALLGRKSEFIRTPKFKLVNGTHSILNSKYNDNLKLDSSVFVELVLALYCAVGVIASIYYLEIAALPFQLLFCGGFGIVSILSLKHSFFKTNGNQKWKKDPQTIK
jgi:cellulose synthase/poly-beta-1,6-N-acetylglucosamine synthase-like glycosyltransferase